MWRLLELGYVLKGHSDMTIYTPELVQRNATFAAGGAFKGLPFPTNPALRVIGCVDSRVDPGDVLGLKLAAFIQQPVRHVYRRQRTAPLPPL